MSIRRRPTLLLPVGVLAVIGVAAALMGVAVHQVSAPPADSATSSAQVDVAAAADHEAVAGFRGEQLANAARIMNAGSARGMDRYGQTVAVMTAAGESSLRVLTYGDAAGPDSRGLFQQRDSWGSRADRLDAATSAGLFYDRLVQVPDWRELEPTEAAHAVQRNADPDHYARYWRPAQQIVDVLSA